MKRRESHEHMEGRKTRKVTGNFKCGFGLPFKSHLWHLVAWIVQAAGFAKRLEWGEEDEGEKICQRRS